MAGSLTYTMLSEEDKNEFLGSVATNLMGSYRIAKNKASVFSDANVLVVARPLLNAICGEDKKLGGGTAKRFLADFDAFIVDSTEASHKAAHRISLLPEWASRNASTSRADSEEEEEDDDEDIHRRKSSGKGKAKPASAKKPTPKKVDTIALMARQNSQDLMEALADADEEEQRAAEQEAAVIAKRAAELKAIREKKNEAKAKKEQVAASLTKRTLDKTAKQRAERLQNRAALKAKASVGAGAGSKRAPVKPASDVDEDEEEDNDYEDGAAASAVIPTDDDNNDDDDAYVGISNDLQLDDDNVSGTNPKSSASQPAAAKKQRVHEPPKGDDVSEFLDSLPTKVFRMLKSKGAVDGDGNVLKAVSLTEDEEDLIGETKTLRTLQKFGVVAK